MSITILNKFLVGFASVAILVLSAANMSIGQGQKVWQGGGQSNPGQKIENKEEGGSPNVPVTLCHVTSSVTNPYVTLTVPNQAVANAHIGHTNQQGLMDIVPAPAGGCPGGGTTNPGAVPEPISMLLFGAGLAGVGYIARRRKQQAE